MKRFLCISLLAFVLAVAVLAAPSGVSVVDSASEIPTQTYDTASLSQDIWDGTIATGFDSGTGTEADPYIIKTPEQLAFLASSVNSGTSYGGKFIKLANDIYLNDTTDWENWEITAPANSWTPIGNDSNDFRGTFDGNGCEIGGIYINTTSNYQGLFGDVYGGDVKNVGVVDSYIKGSNYVGSVVGHSNYGTVENCYNTGTIRSALALYSEYETYFVYGYIGGVAGVGNTTNCYNAGKVLIYANYYGSYGATVCVGGVAGVGSTTNCYNTGVVSIYSSSNISGVAGGVVGGGDATNCYNTGDVDSSNIGSVNSGGNVGGVVGAGSAKNCYNTGTVARSFNYSGSEERVGGVVGYNEGTVSNCYNIGTVTGVSRYVGGVVGYNSSSATVTNTYYLTGCATDGEGVVQYGMGNGYQGFTTADVEGQTTRLTDEQMKQKTSFPGFDFEYVWTIEAQTGYEYPLLIVLLDKSYGENSAIWDGSIATGFDSGSGTEAEPYIIKTAEQLAFFASSVNSGTDYSDEFIKLANDIYLNDNTKKYWILNATPWTPIGISSNKFRGTFDGDGHEISGIYINTTSDCQGLFGYVDYNGTVKNVGVVDSYINGGRYVGGVVGDNEGTVSNCYNTGDITGSSSVGGVVGHNWKGTVEKCYNAGDTSGVNNVGGVVGNNDYGTATVENCYNTGKVTGSSSVGGVVGYNYVYSGTATVENCYNIGTVTGVSRYVGGVVGGNSGTVSNCYNIGKVTGSSYVGGVVGDNSGTVSNCYNTGTVSDSDYNVGGVVGDNDGTMANCYYLTGCAKDGNGVIQYGIGNYPKGSTTADVLGCTTDLTDAQMKIKENFIGFDFENVWGIDSDTNGGYPYLLGMPVVEKEEYKLGDITGDDSLDIADAILLFQHSMMPEIYTVDYTASMDFNKDGVLDISDAILLFQHSMMPNLYPLI